jgi:hypothetical protein
VSPAVLFTWALVIVVVSFCSGYQLAGYLEADKAERAAAALRCAREAWAVSRADAYTAREFSARLLANAVAARREREAAEEAQDRPETALGRAQDRQFEQPRQGAACTEAADAGTVRDSAIDFAVHARHLRSWAEPEAGR